MMITPFSLREMVKETTLAPEITREALLEAADEIELMCRQHAGDEREIERLNELLRGVGANRYWEGRYRDERKENDKLRAALKVLWDRTRYD
jgi:hypothetical protein